MTFHRTCKSNKREFDKLRKSKTCPNLQALCYYLDDANYKAQVRTYSEISDAKFLADYAYASQINNYSKQSASTNEICTSSLDTFLNGILDDFDFDGFAMPGKHCLSNAVETLKVDHK